MILKYEEQTNERDSELQAVQMAIKESMTNVEIANEGLKAEIIEISVKN